MDENALATRSTESITPRIMQRLVTAFLVMMLLSACGTIEKEKKSQSLHNSTRFYEYALRWSDYEKADGMRKPESLSQSPDPASLEKYRVTSYKTLDSSMSADGMVYNQVIEIHYYNEDNLRERKITDRQEWVYDQDADVWYLDGPLPSFR
jgi:uncharacterized protein YceK